MPSPIQSLRFVHEAILHEAARVDDAIHGALTPEGAAALAHEVAAYAELMHAHTHGEEIGLFPDLAAREPHLADTYLHDHVEERDRLKQIHTLLEGLASGEPVDLGALRRASSALRAHTTAHVEKENTLVLPYVEQAFDVPSQAAMVQKILGAIPREQMPKVVPWLVSRLSDDTACAYVGMLSQVMPAPAFQAAQGWIRAGCAASRVALLQSRVAAFV